MVQVEAEEEPDEPSGPVEDGDGSATDSADGEEDDIMDSTSKGQEETSVGTESEAKETSESAEAAPEMVAFPPPSLTEFKVDDTLYCQYGATMFLSKVLKVEIKPPSTTALAQDDQARPKIPERAYFVHYNGWSKRFDAWIEQDFVFDDNEENKAVKQALDAQEKERRRAKREQKALLEDNRSSVGTKRDRKQKNPTVKRAKKAKVVPEKRIVSDAVLAARRAGRASQMSVNTKKEMDKTEYIEHFKLNLGLNLKKRLVQDWEMVAQDKRLIMLPRKPHVRDILAQYVQHRKEQKKLTSKAVQVYEELSAGVQEAFDQSLGKCLLYRLERQQHDTIMEKTTYAVSEVYGVEHLLRLFVKLPVLLSMCDMEPDDAQKLQAYLQDFLQYLSAPAGQQLFGTRYIVPEEEYLTAFAAKAEESIKREGKDFNAVMEQEPAGPSSEEVVTAAL